MRTVTALLLVLGLPLALATGPRVVAKAAEPDPEEWMASQLEGWEDGAASEGFLAMRQVNPEYDLMARTFTVLALGDRSLGSPARAAGDLAVMDAMIGDTLAMEQAHGQAWYLLPYAHRAAFEGTGRSLFVDGELLVMMGVRELVAERVGAEPRWGAEQARYVARVREDLDGNALGIAESYPDEGWTFCHAMALLGLRLDEVVNGSDHAEPIDAFLETARSRLVHAPTGMLVSEFDMHGRHHDGPEGSSNWFVSTVLAVLDPELGAAQYQLARGELGRSLLGLGYAREWPEGHENHEDIDSGPIVPGLEASASSSGLAIAAAAAHGDRRWHGQLRAALGASEILLAASPELAEVADNPVGRGVVLWGLGFGPVWQELTADR